MAEEVLLFGAWVSPFSGRIEIALKLKGVQYKYVEEDLTNKSPALLQYNPVHKKVPVLVHNGKSIAESQVILEYIDETWQGYPILPKDPHERAVARFWAKLIDEKCLPALVTACWHADQKEREEAVEEINKQLRFLEDELNEKRFFGREKIRFVDIVGNAIAFWIGVFEEASGKEVMAREKFPKLCKWADEFLSYSVIKESLPPRDKLIAYYRNRFGAGTSK